MAFLSIRKLINNNYTAFIIAIALTAGFSAYLVLNAAIEKEKNTLVNNVQILASVVGSVAEYDSVHSADAIFNKDFATATLQKINNGFSGFTRSREDYEYMIVEMFGDEIDIIGYSGQKPEVIEDAYASFAEPMRRALEKQTGVTTYSDVKGNFLLAAYTPITKTNWGLVVQIPFSHFLQPFYVTAFWLLMLTGLLSYFVYALTKSRENRFANEIADRDMRFKQMVESSNDWVWEVNNQGEYTYSSPQVFELIGYHPEEVVGKTAFAFMTKSEAIFLQRKFMDYVGSGMDIKNLEHTSTHRNGKKVHMLSSGTAFYDKQGKLIGYRGIDRDITAIKEHQLRIEDMAYFDPLTKLANRQNITSRIEEEIDFCQRNDFVSSILYLDLDGFKDINDALGHDYGDKVLKTISKRLKRLARTTDTIGRLGGDEFVVLLRNTTTDSKETTQQLILFLNRMLEVIRKPIEGDHPPLHVGASIGVALIPEDGKTVHELLRHADSAMYEAKSQGKNQFVFYHARLQDEADRRVRFKSELTQAFKNNEFELFYQKQYDITGTKLYGAEALIRWNNPEKGYISPGDFLPFIEEFHLTKQLDRWVVNQACIDLSNDLADLPENTSVSINFTSSSFESDDFIEYLLETCQKYHVPTERLALEITEDSIISNVEKASEALTKLKQANFSISIDDFGTGYSSLSYLSQLNFDTIKIDKSFIKQIYPGSTDHYICKLIIKLAQDLEKRIIAEGVETENQIEFLDQYGVDVIQGFIYAKPQPAKEILTDKKQ